MEQTTMPLFPLGKTRWWGGCKQRLWPVNCIWKIVEHRRSCVWWSRRLRCTAAA